MAIRGPVPKDPSMLVRRNKPAGVSVLVADGGVYGPDLPDLQEWPEQTRVWWDTWRSSPQASSMGGTDWCFMLETAVLHAEFWAGDHRVSLVAEIRARVAKFGATPEDRQRLRIAVVGDLGRPQAPLVRSDGERASQRARLLKSVGYE